MMLVIGFGVDHNKIAGRNVGPTAVQSAQLSGLRSGYLGLGVSSRWPYSICCSPCLSSSAIPASTFIFDLPFGSGLT